MNILSKIRIIDRFLIMLSGWMVFIVIVFIRGFIWFVLIFDVFECVKVFSIIYVNLFICKK